MTKTKTNTYRKLLQRAILETCDLWDIWSEWWGDMNWPKRNNDKYKDKDNDKDKDILRAHSKSDRRDLWPLRHLINVIRTHDLTKKRETMTKTKKMTKTKTNTFKHLQRAILWTCDFWDTDYISDNWEPESMTIFVTWQLRVTLDSIRNSCDVYRLCQKSSMYQNLHTGWHWTSLENGLYDIV